MSENLLDVAVVELINSMLNSFKFDICVWIVMVDLCLTLNIADNLIESDQMD